MESTHAPRSRPPRIALVYPGDRAPRAESAPENSRFSPLFKALAERGAVAEPAIYHDDVREDVLRQLLEVDAALVWVNPVEGGHDRTALDAMLREVAEAGVFVSAHPDVILALGTKQVLFETRHLGWGCDTHVHRSLEGLRRDLPALLAAGEARVLKQSRGQSGEGVWKVQRDDDGRLRVRHARRGAAEERMSPDEFLERCSIYFERDGSMIDQAYQARLPEGMVRCYLVHDRVEGFGLQAVNALHPDTTQPGPRLYHPPTLSRCQRLKRMLETTWVPELQRHFGLQRTQLPLLWDCDFLLGPKDAGGEDSYVLCEINVSSVAPFPESAVAPLARAAIERACGTP